jgi:hypothetical protein
VSRAVVPDRSGLAAEEGHQIRSPSLSQHLALIAFYTVAHAPQSRR